MSSRSQGDEELLLSIGSGSLVNISIYGAKELLLSSGSRVVLCMSPGAEELILRRGSRAVSSRSQGAEELLLSIDSGSLVNISVQEAKE